MTMGIQLEKMRISNFRSIEYCDICFDNLNVIIGQNNVGKSNILRAVYIALNAAATVSERDIHIEKGEELPSRKSAIIDILIRPTDSTGEIADDFSNFWVSTFSADWISTDLEGRSFVGIRTTIYYDSNFDQYRIQKAPIQQWNELFEDTICGKKRAFTQDMQSYIYCFYMDAHRDISEDIKSKKSFFGRATSSRDLPAAMVSEIEQDLNNINAKIISNAPSLKSTQDIISQVGNVIGNSTDLQIEPISRKISDLQRGMDIKLSEIDSANLSISEQGMGTRSWTSFLTLDAYIVGLTRQIQQEDPEAELFAILALEEPEAHLHSHAQKRLFNQIISFPGQKIISTHSAIILAQAPIESLIHLYKSNAQTKAHKIKKQKYSIDELDIIKREVIRSRGDLLFSNAIVFAEGITEESSLPIFFEKYFGQDAFSAGVSIVGVGGQRYKAFLHLVKDFDIPWFIFSDGEEKTMRTVRKAVEDTYGSECSELTNIVFLDNGDDYEKYLIHAGYAEEMISAINKYEKMICEEQCPEDAKHNPLDYFNRYIATHNHEKDGKIATGKTCPSCGQPLKQDKIRIYDGDEGRKIALLDICQRGGGKAKYAVPIAKEITNTAAQAVPPKMEELFCKLHDKLLIREGEYRGN